MAPPSLDISPPLLNSSCPWATTKTHLENLLLHPSTGGVTTRTSLLSGFPHAPSQHRFAYFTPPGSAVSKTFSYPDDKDTPHTDYHISPEDAPAASLNNLGYSPLTLEEYISILQELSHSLPRTTHRKTIIISVTGSPSDISQSCVVIAAAQLPWRVAIELNLSCPNIPGLPPPAYDPEGLRAYLDAVPPGLPVPVGVKTPPYTHAGQFKDLAAALRSGGCGKISFITATNTLGNCLVLDQGGEPVLPGTGMGGMAGAALHPLALGNVASLRGVLDETEELRHVQIIGVGGVSDGQGYKRMRSAGASAVALATALGRKGPDIFSQVGKEINYEW